LIARPLSCFLWVLIEYLKVIGFANFLCGAAFVLLLRGGSKDTVAAEVLAAVLSARDPQEEDISADQPSKSKRKKPNTSQLFDVWLYSAGSVLVVI
jgi:hypothetical protein